MKFLIDLHVHSKFSGDTDSDPEESIIQAINLNLDGIAFTEHYSYEASEGIEMLKENYSWRIGIFRGVEFSAAEGHCLIFGVNTDKLLIRHAPVLDLIRIVNEKGGVVIPSHPYRMENSLGDKVDAATGICALEGYNGCNMRAYNERAIKAAKALNLPYTGGSDAHLPQEVGLCYTAFEDTVTDDNFVDQLRAGNYQGFDKRKLGKG
ncbi:MAG TPA: metal-dependent phosphohydrolase [Nitrospiraceae bacterium]|jgi:histidinol phosphatase-like PHP family hydrolase|nr:metal-dependent phosphohydrolase [Nitrospiraceae bacterium]